ncbi:MAG TPA: tRNA 2-thiouridine(34) synthase MnmA [Solirubrobacteraceae bacterium]|jgi:tRNA-specific 2-thiouridylase|nr:tRNA 2-thiouridine(34) synthase MnmA [Solirubrobacteraceae bacterium]
MDTLAFEHHLTSPQGEGHTPADAFTVTFGGGDCCDEVTFSVQSDGRRVTDAGFSANGCGASHAAASAAVTLVRGVTLLQAASVGAAEIAAELGGLSPAKQHAANVAADALARALGAAVRARGALPGPAGPAARRTLVAMSGGVDSSVAALLCQQDGEAVAVTLELWTDTENDAEKSCCSTSAVSQARALAHRLGLPHFTLDLRAEFRAGVVEPFIASYSAGDTPNPCIGCNGHVRLDAMLEFADRLGAATLATGHYARVEDGLLKLAADAAKDQTYMLAGLAPESLARMRFPLGEYEKPQVREIAARAGLPVASKVDSQDLCFLAGTSRARFLERHGEISPQPGEVVDSDGRVLGRHGGHELFTVGQRRGLGIYSSEPLFVLDKDAASNRVVVGPHDRLLTDRVRVRGARLHRDGARVDRVKLRYRSQALPARIRESAPAGRHRELMLELDEPVAGAAPGQLACLMDGELIVGWATITR